jgi:hypothetical protein
MYALLFSVMYMGMSGITGMTSFTNTFLFSFLDTFCFPGDTILRIQREGEQMIQELPLREVRIGDRLYPSMDRVTACFRFHATGQPMVRFGRIQVSTNHYIYHGGKRVRAEHHPDATSRGPWLSEEPLYCLNTDTHHIPIDGYVFMDYDETPTADEETMRWVERQIQPLPSLSSPSVKATEYGMAVSSDTRIRLSSGEVVCADKVKLGDKMVTGGTVAGVIRKEVEQWVTLSDGSRMTPSTLFWDATEERWKRWRDVLSPSSSTSSTPSTSSTSMPPIFCSWVILPHSQVELESGLRLRDYLEYASPETEHLYREHLEAKEEPVSK